MRQVQTPVNMPAGVVGGSGTVAVAVGDGPERGIGGQHTCNLCRKIGSTMDSPGCWSGQSWMS